MKNGSVLSREKVENRKNLKRAIFSVRWGLRYYNPELGRWLTRDPIGEKGGVNSYVFTDNFPLVKLDPYGLATVQQFGSVMSKLKAAISTPNYTVRGQNRAKITGAEHKKVPKSPNSVVRKKYN